jgi:hypothetical protein
MGKKRLLVISPNPADATSFWRCWGPMAELEKTMDVTIEFHEIEKDVDWHLLKRCDAVFLQRPANDYHKATIAKAKDRKMPVWIDYDDDMFNIPTSNPAHYVFSNKETLRNIMTMINWADVVSVSTADLQQKYSQWNKNVEVIPNAWDMREFGYREEGKIAKAKAVLWRGSQTHAGDLDAFLPQISRLANDHPEWKFVFIGGPYWKIHDAIPGKQLVIYESLEQLQFYRVIYDFGAKIMMVPLMDHTFNRAKSNIAWQEAVFCGSVPVCPNWEEWQKPGAVLYDNPDDFENIMRRMMMPGADLCTLADQGWEYVRDNLTLEKMNQKRRNIVHKILGIN